MRMRFAAALYVALALALAAFALPAFAGDHGGGGQGHDQGQAAQKQSSTQQSTGDNSTGVKPSNATTAHKNTRADSSSNKTKQYGNGKTAGQIAERAGYHGDLYGPGNSQPHKASCGGHEVDVHALKSHGSKCGQVQPASQVKAAHHTEHVSKSKREESKQVEQTKQTEQKTESEQQTQAATASAHVTICHATGSATNPFVMISPAASGVYHGHLGHQDQRDIVPPFTWNGTTISQNWDTNGQAIFNAGCKVSTVSSASTQSTQSEQESEQQSTQSATSIQSAQTAQAPQQQVAAVQVTTTATPAAPASGVKGAVVALKRPKSKPAGGVLGATARLGRTVRSATLPFTGLPLWPFLLFGAALVAMGLVARRAGTAQR